MCGFWVMVELNAGKFKNFRKAKLVRKRSYLGQIIIVDIVFIDHIMFSFTVHVHLTPVQDALR